MEKAVKSLVVLFFIAVGSYAQNLDLAIISDSTHVYDARGDKVRMIRSIPAGGIRNLADGGLQVLTELHGLIIEKDSLGNEISRSYKSLPNLVDTKRYRYAKAEVDASFNAIDISITPNTDSYSDKMKQIYLTMFISETESALDSDGNPTGLFGGDNFEIYVEP